MKNEKINDWRDMALGAIVVGVVVFLLFSVVPFLVIFSANTVAGWGGSAFNIDHGFINYLVIYIILIVTKLFFFGGGK